VVVVVGWGVGGRGAALAIGECPGLFSWKQSSILRARSKDLGVAGPEVHTELLSLNIL
jgi:hypothetical protein